MVVRRLLSFWDSLFSGAMLNFRKVLYFSELGKHHGFISEESISFFPPKGFETNFWVCAWTLRSKHHLCQLGVVTREPMGNVEDRNMWRQPP